MSETDRQLRRRNELLDALEKAEKEWGERQETLLTKEASFLQKVLDRRLGSGAAAGRIEDALTDLTVDVIDEFLTGGSP